MAGFARRWAQPLWRPDGHELFYIAPDRKLIGVELRVGRSDFALGDARELMQTRITGWEHVAGAPQYAVTPDGERFLVTTDTAAVRPITVVVNWTARLQ